MSDMLAKSLLRERHIVSPEGFVVDLSEMTARGSVRFYRQATPDGKGGGYVAENSYVPPHVVVHWRTMVLENTVVFDDADFSGAGQTIAGKTFRVSRPMHDDERCSPWSNNKRGRCTLEDCLPCRARRYRVELRYGWRRPLIVRSATGS